MDPDSLIYRLAGLEDLPTLAQIRWDFRMEGQPARPAQERAHFVEVCRGFLHKALESRRWAFWVAEHQGQIVAQCFVQVIRKVPRPSNL